MGEIISTGTVHVTSGMTLTEPDIRNYGVVMVSSGGQVRSAHIFYGGHEVISSAGVDYGARLENDATVYVLLDGSMASAHVGYDAFVSVQGGIVYAPTIDSAGSMNVIGSRITSATVSLGTVNNATLTHNGRLTIGQYGEVSGALVRSGTVTVYKDGLVRSVYLGNASGNSGDAALILSEGRASRTIVSANGIMEMLQGATAYETVISSGGSMEVFASGAVATGVTVNVGGVLVVGSPGSAVQVVENGGFVFCDEDRVSFQSNTLSGLVLNDYATLHSGTTATNTIVTSGGIRVYSSGLADGTILNSGCGMEVNSGGTANSTTLFASCWVSGGTINSATIHSGGAMEIGEGGAANDVTVNSGGALWFDSDCTGRRIRENGGYVVFVNGADVTFVANTISGAVLDKAATVHSGTIVTETVVNSHLNIYSGGIASGVTANGTSTWICVDSGGLADGTIVNSGGIQVFSGGSVDHTTVNAGYLDVSSATADHTTVSSGVFRVEKAATAANTTVYGGGMVVNGSSIVSGTVVSGGTLYLANATANSTTLFGGFMNVSSGASAKTVRASGGTMNLLANATATGVVALGGTVNISSGAVLNSASAQDGRIRVYSGGTAVANRATKTGRIVANSNGVLLSCVALASGRVELEGGAALATEVGAAGLMLVEGAPHLSGGKDSSLANGIASNTRIHLGAIASVGSGGAMIDTVVGYSSASLDPLNPKIDLPSVLLERAGLYINSSGIASGVTASKGAIVAVANQGMLVSAKVSSGASAQILAGGTARTLSILRGGSASIKGKATSMNIASAATAVIGNGGSASTVTVSAGGTLRAEAGAKLANVSVISGGIVTGRFAGLAAQAVTLTDGILDFDVSDLGADEICVDQLNTAFAGTYSCTLTVGDEMAEGTYRLAADAAGFEKTITVQNTSRETLGTLTVGGTTNIGGVDYTLALGGDNVLSVSVVGAVAPVGTAKSDVDGNGVSDVMFVWTGEHGEGNYQHGYWMNGTSEWRSAGSNHPAEWDNLGCHDMTGDGKADSVLFGNVTTEAGIKGAYVGYYADANDLPDGSTWVNIGYLTNEDDIDWKNTVGNLTGSESGVNSIVWYTHELGALGAWTDGTDAWVNIAGGFDATWSLVGCGDFDGDGADSVVMSLNSGANYYAVALDGTFTDLGVSDSGWALQAIGDFAGDGIDDIVAFHKETGIVAMWGDGLSANWSQLGQLDASDWFVVGCGDYNADAKDDLLVRQYSTGMLGYYSSGDMSNWNVLGYGVDMSWTVIA